jgi:hypothetical protein
VDKNHLEHSKDQHWAFLNTVINIQATQKAEGTLTT